MPDITQGVERVALVSGDTIDVLIKHCLLGVVVNCMEDCSLSLDECINTCESLVLRLVRTSVCVDDPLTVSL